MEFFRILDIRTDEMTLHRCLTTNRIEKLSNLIFPVGEVGTDAVEIGGLWGEFNLLHSEIRGGVRFALKECPNALAWTVTTGFPPAPDSVVVHLTINRVTKAGDLVEEIEEFLNDHLTCLEGFLQTERIGSCAN